MKYEEIFGAIMDECKRARAKHPAFHSHHEAYAVIKEEFEEWWDSVKADQPDRAELIQVAAMCVTALVELDHPVPNLQVADFSDLDLYDDGRSPVFGLDDDPVLLDSLDLAGAAAEMEPLGGAASIFAKPSSLPA